MTLVEPIPDLQWGRGDWQDYISNWREKDAEWMQARTILRYQTPAARTTDWGATPSAGQVTYNHTSQTLEMWRAGTTNSWVRSLMFQNLNADQDTAAGVKVSHLSSGAKGVLFSPTNIVIDAPLNVMGGMLQVDATSVGVQSASQKLAKLTTNATELLSDTPLVASAIRLTGTGTVINTTGAITVGGVTATSFTTTGNISATGSGIVSGAQVNGNRGAIGGVNLGWDTGNNAASSGNVFANGLVASGSIFYGDSTNAWMRQRNPTTGVLGTALVQVNPTDAFLQGNTVQSLGQFQIRSGRSIQYFNAANSQSWNGGPVIYGADPGVANVPEGTVWVS